MSYFDNTQLTIQKQNSKNLSSRDETNMSLSKSIRTLSFLPTTDNKKKANASNIKYIEKLNRADQRVNCDVSIHVNSITVSNSSGSSLSSQAGPYSLQILRGPLASEPMLVNLPSSIKQKDQPVTIPVDLHLQVNTIMYRSLNQKIYAKKDATIRLLKDGVSNGENSCTRSTLTWPIT